MVIFHRYVSFQPITAGAPPCTIVLYCSVVPVKCFRNFKQWRIRGSSHAATLDFTMFPMRTPVHHTALNGNSIRTLRRGHRLVLLGVKNHHQTFKGLWNPPCVAWRWRKEHRALLALPSSLKTQLLPVILCPSFKLTCLMDPFSVNFCMHVCTMVYGRCISTIPMVYKLINHRSHHWAPLANPMNRWMVFQGFSDCAARSKILIRTQRPRRHSPGGIWIDDVSICTRYTYSIYRQTLRLILLVRWSA